MYDGHRFGDKAGLEKIFAGFYLMGDEPLYEGYLAAELKKTKARAAKCIKTENPITFA